MYRVATIRAKGSTARAVRGVVLKPRKGMGETQCNIDPATGGRVCKDVFVPGATASTSSSSTTTNTALAPRPSRSSRYADLIAAAQSSAPAQAAASTPPVSGADALSSLSTSIATAVNSLNLSGTDWVGFVPNWAVLLGVGVAGYYFTHQRSRGRYR